MARRARTIPVHARGLAVSPSRSDRQEDAHHRRERDDGEDEVGGAAPQRVEEDELPGRAQEPRRRAQDDRAQVVLGDPADDRERDHRAGDHGEGPDRVAEGGGEAVLLRALDEGAPDPPEEHGDDGVEEPEVGFHRAPGGATASDHDHLDVAGAQRGQHLRARPRVGDDLVDRRPASRSRRGCGAGTSRRPPPRPPRGRPGSSPR